MYTLSQPSFETLAAGHRAGRPGARLAIPVYRIRSADLLTPVAAYLALRRSGDFGFLLESVEQSDRGRYSILGRRPYLVIEARGRETFLRRPNRGAMGDGAAIERVPGTVLDVIRRLVADVEEVKLHELPHFTGGAVGMLAYDAVRLLEDLPSPPPDDLDTPDALWGFFDTVAVFDHVTHRIALIATVFLDPEDDLDAAYADAQLRLDALEADLLAGPKHHPTVIDLDAEAVCANVAPETFTTAVLRAKEHIREGDIFQVVLSQRFAVPYAGDPFLLYRALRQANPSPYLFFLDFEEADGRPLILAGSSPEVLVRVRDQHAEMLPIAGTRPRGETPEADLAFAESLEADLKEQAEHLMLVDLGRNDLSRSCRAGSVRVERYAGVERYARVMHLVSSVIGEVDPARTGLDVLAGCFPAGTVTGAPKVRAMQLIDELEPTRRGPYAGAVGYVDFSGNTDTCITIRTMLIRPDSPAGDSGTVYIQAGAGIVADSSPDAELAETHNKARALFDALRQAASGLL